MQAGRLSPAPTATAMASWLGQGQRGGVLDPRSAADYCGLSARAALDSWTALLTEMVVSLLILTGLGFGTRASVALAAERIQQLAEERNALRPFGDVRR